MINLDKIAFKLFSSSLIKDAIVPALKINTCINCGANLFLFFDFVYKTCNLLFWDHSTKKLIDQTINHWFFLILFVICWDLQK